MIDAEYLTSRAMRVILSCESMKQLEIAVKYASLCYKTIDESSIGGIAAIGFGSRMDRSIGFAQCQIKFIEDLK